MPYRRLRDIREDHDLKQWQLGEVLGVRQYLYSSYERGRCEIPIPYLIILADYYQTSVDYLLGRTNDPKPPNE